ncbi:LysR family transcriptional regulator [Rhizobium sp. CB3090]|uniref:LysR family transcriptional regulator n=1 Tax=Rhizobium sp. CB3090 TaxID=3039156 RepID=UPI0024B2688E|nr:LysR family transcriptional regulator [Rhizobium sp. CB3090]WFU11158.1 LysR family transcriptional regulator [Rhizobium sp. CB3090]
MSPADERATRPRCRCSLWWHIEAADELGIVRGAVCRQLAAFETFFGIVLFQRHGRRHALTGKGTVGFGD